MIIKDYDRELSLSNYNLNDVYTFLIHNPNRLPDANEETIRKYSPTLNQIINDYPLTDNYSSTLSKKIGIVVDKHESNNIKDIDKITVMFKTDDNRYVINKYVVNHIVK